MATPIYNETEAAKIRKRDRIQADNKAKRRMEARKKIEDRRIAKEFGLNCEDVVGENETN